MPTGSHASQNPYTGVTLLVTGDPPSGAGLSYSVPSLARESRPMRASIPIAGAPRSFTRFDHRVVVRRSGHAIAARLAPRQRRAEAGIAAPPASANSSTYA